MLGYKVYFLLGTMVHGMRTEYGESPPPPPVYEKYRLNLVKPPFFREIKKTLSTPLKLGNVLFSLFLKKNPQQFLMSSSQKNKFLKICQCANKAECRTS